MARQEVGGLADVEHRASLVDEDGAVREGCGVAEDDVVGVEELHGQAGSVSQS